MYKISRNHIAYCLTVVIVLTTIAGCTNPYSDFYHQIADRTVAAAYLEPLDSSPQIINGSDPKQDEIRMISDGYVMLGYSSFNASEVNNQKSLDQAKKIGASVVLITQNYNGSISSAMPLTLPNTTTTFVNGTAFGSGGFANYTGTAT